MKRRADMIKILVILSLAGSIGWGEILDYRVRSPLMGTLGTIHIDRKVSGTRYRMDVDVKSRGIAAVLTGHRREHYRSEGDMARGRMLSRHLVLDRRTDSKRKIDDYRIDTQKRKVVKHRTQWRKGKKEQENNQVLPYYTREDLLTLYFNAMPRIRDAQGQKHWEILAVGAEKIKGKVIIDRLSGAAAQKARDGLDVGKNTPVIVLHSPQKIAGKRNRSFTAALDSEGLPTKIRFVAIPVVGEILIERVQK